MSKNELLFASLRGLGKTPKRKTPTGTAKAGATTKPQPQPQPQAKTKARSSAARQPERLCSMLSAIQKGLSAWRQRPQEARYWSQRAPVVSDSAAPLRDGPDAVARQVMAATAKARGERVDQPSGPGADAAKAVLAARDAAHAPPPGPTGRHADIANLILAAGAKARGEQQAATTKDLHPTAKRILAAAAKARGEC